MTKTKPLKTNVPDLGDMRELWDMKEDIMYFLKGTYWMSDFGSSVGHDADVLIRKIESIGKKEGE